MKTDSNGTKSAMLSSSPSATGSSPATGGRRPLWPLLGILVAVLGVVTFLGSGIEVPKAGHIADPITLLALAREHRWRVMAFSGAGFLVWALLIVYVAQLRLHIAARLPKGSILPELVWAGGILTAAAQFTALFFTSLLVHRAAEGYNVSALLPIQAINEGLSACAWTPMGLAVFAIAAAGLRHHALPQWLSWFSALATTLIAILTATDLLAPNWFVVAVWLFVTSAVLLAPCEDNIAKPSTGQTLDYTQGRAGPLL